jgi:hypothetical protein
VAAPIASTANQLLEVMVMVLRHVTAGGHHPPNAFVEKRRDLWFRSRLLQVDVSVRSLCRSATLISNAVSVYSANSPSSVTFTYRNARQNKRESLRYPVAASASTLKTSSAREAGFRTTIVLVHTLLHVSSAIRSDQLQPLVIHELQQNRV